MLNSERKAKQTLHIQDTWLSFLFFSVAGSELAWIAHGKSVGVWRVKESGRLKKKGVRESYSFWNANVCEVFISLRECLSEECECDRVSEWMCECEGSVA